jgi:hypothetical protein
MPSPAGGRVGFIDCTLAEGAPLGGDVRLEYADLTDTAVLPAVGRIAVVLNNAARDERHTVGGVDDACFDNRIAVNL